MSSAIEDKLRDATRLVTEASQEIDDLQSEIAHKKQRLEDLMITKVTMEGVDFDRVGAFLDKPYVMLPKKANEVWVAVPRFWPFHIGWLERQDESYNVFVINKYVNWITPLPEDIKRRVGIRSTFEKAKVSQIDTGAYILEVEEEELEKAWNRYKDNLYARVSKTEIKINRGREFQVIAKLIDDGNLPFSRNPITKTQLRPPPSNIKLREYQKRAWNRFLETGMIGVYWAPGAGKTFLALYSGERLSGKKLVVVPSNTLKEQWQERICKFCQHQWEWEVQTYQYITGYHMPEYQNKKVALTIYDECHHLPANTFAKLATINTQYRIGLSASPYREDGRTEYIFALTGFPVGLRWLELINLGVVGEPDIWVYLYTTGHKKRRDLKNIVEHSTGKILIYCDSISGGKSLSHELTVPFVYGQTENRMDKFRDNRIVIGSRVADEGLSIPTIDTVIEYDFLYGSRRQEAQRAGRLMHSTEGGQHIIMMTDKELQNYGKRLYSLEEQGFNIKFQRRQ